jgi:hypothetical protein
MNPTNHIISRQLTFRILYTTVIKVACADGFQREGPDKLTCQVDKSFSGNVSCVGEYVKF